MPLKPLKDKRSPAQKRAERDETQQIPKIPQRKELTTNDRFDEGQIRIQEYRDNRKGKGVVHKMLMFKTDDGTKSVLPIKPEWDNDTGEPRLTVEFEIDGKIRTYYVTLTEKVG